MNTQMITSSKINFIQNNDDEIMMVVVSFFVGIKK
jgi:hypothetical protein